MRELLGKRPRSSASAWATRSSGSPRGGRTYKLKFGHRGGNQPVKDLPTGRVEITAQNHGFAVDMQSVAPRGMLRSRRTSTSTTTRCEGLPHRRLPLFSVQYHPEASPGPHDASYLFDRFVELMANKKGG